MRNSAVRGPKMANSLPITLRMYRRLASGLVPAVAAWTAAFIDAAAELVERVRGLRLRTVTRMMEAELERVGFYDACDEALQR